MSRFSGRRHSAATIEAMSQAQCARWDNGLAQRKCGHGERAAQVMSLTKLHPDWSSDRIAAALDVEGGYVRTTWRRQGCIRPSQGGL